VAVQKPKKSVQKPKRIDQKVSLSSPKRSSLDAVQKILFSKWHPKGRKYFFSHDKQKKINSLSEATAFLKQCQIGERQMAASI